MIPVLLVYSPASISSIFSAPQLVRDMLLSAGEWGAVLFIGFTALSIILPFPSTTIVVAGGYVYGILAGTALALVGLVIGSCIIFLLVRRFGKPLLEKLVDAHHIAHFNHVFEKRGATAAFISYIVPVFPSDTVTLLLGLTPIPFRTFLLILTVGHIPRYLILNGVGDTFHNGFSSYSILFIVGAVLLLLVVIFRHRLKLLFFRELHMVERKWKQLEGKDLAKKKAKKR